jgi:hypothetical protein
MGFSAASAGTYLTTSVPFQVVMRTVPSFAIITTDPNATQLTANNSVNAFNATYSTINSGLAALTATASGSCSVYGYRSATSAEL